MVDFVQPKLQQSLHAAEDCEFDDKHVLKVYSERAIVMKRERRSLVRAKRTTQARDEVVEEELTHERVVVERVPIGQIVDSIPPVRQEGEVTIMSVVEEVVVVERRLFLKEEVHLRRVRSTERFVETVTLREQQVEVTRTMLDE